MNDEIAKLQSQLDRLSTEFRTAQSRIQKLESRAAWRRPNIATLIAIIAAAALFIGSWTTKASSENSTPIAQSSDVPSTVKAPFQVVDKQGKTILQVGEGDRGAFLYSSSGKRVVSLTATDRDGGVGGGMVAVHSEDNYNNRVAMESTKNESALTVVKNNKSNVAIGTLEGENSASVKLYREDGTKPAVTLESHSDGGALSVFGSTDKPVATLQSDAGDGKLWVSDKSGQQVAGLFAKDGGGVVKVMKAGDPNTYTALNAINAGLGVMVRKSGAKMAFMGATGDSGEKGSVYVYSGTENPIAGMTSFKGGGLVAVFSATAAIAMLSESDKHPGGGEVSVTDPSGNGVFAAGYSGDGGEACVNRKSGLKCLGVGLPLQIQP